MTSDKQLNANRANAKKSTGPQSQAGKDRSRLNSRKHGLTAKMLVIVGENAADFDQLRAELMDEHDPQSPSECELVERLAGILWRLRRVPFFEAAIFYARHHRVWEQYKPKQHDEEGEKNWKVSVHFGRALIGDAIGNDALGKLARHETTLMNAFTKTLQMLLLIQNNRASTQGEPAMLEAVALQPAV